MSNTGQVIVSVIGTTMGLVATYMAWRMLPSREDALEPNMDRVETFLARAAELQARQSVQDAEVRIRIPRDLYESAQSAGIDLSSEGENAIRALLADRLSAEQIPGGQIVLGE